MKCTVELKGRLSEKRSENKKSPFECSLPSERDVSQHATTETEIFLMLQKIKCGFTEYRV